MKKPLVSVISVSYNHEKYIGEALESFVTQKTSFNFEVIIADDCSTDKTPQIIKKYAHNYPNVIRSVLRKHNLGSLENINDALKLATGKYIAICDGDDYWTDSNKLQMQVDFLERHPDYALSFHPTRIIFENNESQGAIWPELDDKNSLTVGDLLAENFIPSNAVMYRRENYDNLPLGIVPGDWYMHLYHAQFGKIGYIDKVMSTYRRHSGGMWWDAHNDQTALWEKHGMSMLALHSEILKIFGDKGEYKSIISKAAADTLDMLVVVDKKFGNGLVKKAMHDLPDITESGIVYKQQLPLAIKEKDQEINALKTEVLELRSTAHLLRDELHALRNSRVLGRIIKARDSIGNPYTIPERSINKARRTVARYVPDSVRLPLMRNLRKTRDGVNRRISQHRDKRVNITVVDNTVREKDIPLVSVVVPYYNRADTIDETLESLEKQTFIDFEVIIVDDNSSDKESIKKLDKLKAAKIIRHKTNQGVAAARNSGIAAAKGMYVICLDSDDVLEETFIEKAVIILETDPDVALVSTYQDAFGVVNELFVKHPYDPLRLLEDNMVITAAMFRRAAWEQTGGYKPGIGYEDWEFWLTLAENGYWGKQLPEPLFKYRTSMQSRYVEDKDVHWKNIKTIRNIHEGYKKRIRSLMAERQSEKHVVSAETALINMNDPKAYSHKIDDKPNVLIAMPWMTFGGAETLIYNLCRQTMDEYNISFVTGLASENEWEYKFREISHDIYHLPNLFDDKVLYVEFLSNFIRTRKIEILHLIHTDFVFEMLPRLKKEFPNLKVVVTMFNDRVPNYVAGVVVQQKYIDIVTSDNQKTVESFKERLSDNANLKAIPNGIDGINEFSPALFDRKQEREKLKLHADDLAVFFVGRLSEEKNPDAFVNVAGRILDTHKNKKIKFYIIGDGPMRHDIEKQLNTIHSDGITYLGYQSEVARYLSAADVFVLPSAIEGFPLSILEAMAMKVVVIASRVGAIPDVIKHGHNGYIVEPGSVNEIEKIIIELESDRKTVEKIKRTEREILERTYSHTQLGRNYKNLYEEALN